MFIFRRKTPFASFIIAKIFEEYIQLLMCCSLLKVKPLAIDQIHTLFFICFFKERKRSLLVSDKSTLPLTIPTLFC